MAVSPSTDNYTLGKGVVYFNQKNDAGVLMGERDLGNAPAFSFNIALEKLEHFSSRGGLKAKDKEIISQITPGVSFTLDEINKENLALLTLAELNEVPAADGTVAAENVTVYTGKRSDLGNRGVTFYTLGYDSGTVIFVVGEVVSGVTGEGIVLAVTGDSTSGTLTIALTTAGFTAEAITGSGTGSATATAAEALGTGTPVVLVENAAQDTVYVAGAEGVGNYQLSETLKDGTIGRILINADQASPAAAIADGDILKISYGFDHGIYTQVQAFKNTQVEGKLRFVSDNPAGTQQELEVWRCSLTPSGDTAMIGDDWSTLGFTGEILKDETNTDSPYMNITIVE